MLFINRRQGIFVHWSKQGIIYRQNYHRKVISFRCERRINCDWMADTHSPSKHHKTYELCSHTRSIAIRCVSVNICTFLFQNTAARTWENITGYLLKSKLFKRTSAGTVMRTDYSWSIKNIGIHSYNGEEKNVVKFWPQ